jgi:leucyl-tRNA synthetase
MLKYIFMTIKYHPQTFEEKWIEEWEKEKIYKTQPLDKNKKDKKRYVLSMFPYPSGDGLHVGHVRIYTGTDVLARYLRMNGYSVLHPMGWDAFGLPAENRAIKEKKNPMDMVPKNIDNFRRQMQRLGFSYDWDKEFSTTDPSYYRFTQWLFIQFFKMGLLEKGEMPVCYCPFCKTGLAEEEVLPDGTHERCQKPITRKTLPQWIFKITKYADRLLEDLKDLDWPQGILQMQKNWIGKSEGAEIKFEISEYKKLRHRDFSTTSPPKGGSPKSLSQNQVAAANSFISCFTTRADTLFGVTALVVAPEHWLIDEILKSKELVDEKKKEEIKKYVEQAKAKLDLARIDLNKEKTGVFTGLYANHPLTGEKIPIWVADYVVGWYGEGAVMVVPAHDERDFEFAKKFNLPVKVVVVDPKNKHEKLEAAFTEDGVLINSNKFDGLTSKEAREKITQKLETLKMGRKAVAYKLRDWIFSRQRYWGEPIPMVYCEKCGWQPLLEEELPLKLPYVQSYEPSETGESPLARIPEFVNTTCPKCGGPAKRETDTMPNWAGSCWYFIAFAFWSKDEEARNRVSHSSGFPPASRGVPSRSKQVSAPSIMKDWQLKIENFGVWLPVDWYLGGAEHAVLHLLYARFWVKALYDLGLLPFKEPFLRLRNVGMVLAEDHRKMSKSFGNVINPDDVVAEYGADSLRLYEMFMAPFSQEIAWSTKALQGSFRFLKRVYELYIKFYSGEKKEVKEDKNLVAKLNKTIKKVSEDIAAIKFNTAIASMMEFLNEWEKTYNAESVTLNVENAKKFLKILAPFAPFLTDEIWRKVFKEKQSIHQSSWPESEAVTDEEVIIPIQINGKLRATIKVTADKLDNQGEIKSMALAIPKIADYLKEGEYKMIYVKGKIVNFVVKK